MITVALALAIIAGAAGCAVRAVHHERAARRRRRDLRAAVRVLSAELQAGGRPADVLAAAADLACTATLRAAARAATRGDSVPAVLATEPALVPVAIAWSVSAVHGAPLADVLGRVAGELDARDAHADRVAAALAGPRSSSALLTAMPVFGVVLGSAMGTRPIAFLVGSRAGHTVLLTGVILDVIGAAWTWWLVTRARRWP